MKHKKVLLQVKASIYDSGEFEKTTNITNNKEELVEKIIAESIAGIIHVNKKLEGVL